METNFFGEIEDYLENWGSPNGNSVRKDTNPPSPVKGMNNAKTALGERLKSRNVAEKRKLEEDSPSNTSNFNEISKTAKLEEAQDLNSENPQELPRAPNRSVPMGGGGLLAQALMEKRPSPNLSNNSILDPVNGTITKDDPYSSANSDDLDLKQPRNGGKSEEVRNYIRQNPNVARLLMRLQKSPKKGPKDVSVSSPPTNHNNFNGDGFSPSAANFENPIASTGGLDVPKDSGEFPPCDQQMMRSNGGYLPIQRRQHNNNNNSRCFNNVPQQQLYSQSQQAPDMGWEYQNGNNSKMMYPQQQQQNMRSTGMMMMRQDFGNVRPPPQMGGFPPGSDFQANPRNYNNYGRQGNFNGGNQYRRMAPQQYNNNNGVPPYNNTNNGVMMRPYVDNFGGGYNNIDEGRSLMVNNDYGGNLHNQQQRMNFVGMIPPPGGSPRMNVPNNVRYDQQQFDFSGNRYSNANRYPDYNQSNNYQRPLSYRPQQPQQQQQQHYQGYPTQEEPLNETPLVVEPVQPQPSQDFEYSTWKNDAVDIRRNLLENLQKALAAQDNPNAASIAERVESEAFKSSDTQDAYVCRIAEWLAGVYCQQQDESSSLVNGSNPPPSTSISSPSSVTTSVSTPTTCPDSTNSWQDNPTVSSTDQIENVLQLDSAGNETSDNHTSAPNKSQVNPILSSLLPAPPPSSAKSVVDELFSSSNSSPATSSASEAPQTDAFQTPMSLSTSSTNATTTTTTAASARRSSGKGGNSVNNPHSVDSGIGSPRSITSSSLYSPKIPQGTSPSLIPATENSPDK